MAVDPVLAVRLLIGAGPSSPFYSLISDEEIYLLLELNGNDIALTARSAALSLSLQLAGGNIKERYGDVEVWSNLASYSKMLDYVINNPTAQIPNGLMPWAGGIDRAEVCANNNDPSVVQVPLEHINTCDSDDVCNPFYQANTCSC